MSKHRLVYRREGRLEALVVTLGMIFASVVVYDVLQFIHS